MLSKKNNKRNTDNRGFTVLELLVVIAIIALLAAIVLVGLSSLREGSKNTATIESLHSFRLWQELYFSVNGVYLPDDCGALSCKICINPGYPAWNWPPINAAGTVPFLSGIPTLHPSVGCLNYFLRPNGYELNFDMFYISSKYRDYNKQLQAIFGLSGSVEEIPCEWFDEDIFRCYVQFSN